MAQVVFAEDSKLLSRTKLRDIYEQSGAVEIQGTNIKLGPNSSVEYRIDYSTVLNPTKATALRFMGELQAENLQTPYNVEEGVSISLSVLYYTKEVTEEGRTNIIDAGTTLATVFPFVVTEPLPEMPESRTDYTQNATDLITRDALISGVYIVFSNNSNEEILLIEPNFYIGETVGEAINTGVQSVAQSLDFSVVLNQLIAYSDGCELYLGNSTNPDRLYYLSDTNNQFAGVKVVPGNGGAARIIKFSRVQEALPVDEG